MVSRVADAVLFAGSVMALRGPSFGTASPGEQSRNSLSLILTSGAISEAGSGSSNDHPPLQFAALNGLKAVLRFALNAIHRGTRDASIAQSRAADAVQALAA